MGELVEEMLKHWPRRAHDQSDPHAPHGAGKLNLRTDKAFHRLGWTPAWGFEEMIKKTVDWYRETAQLEAGDTDKFVRRTKTQIRE